VVKTMRISELAERSGVPIPTVKYYLREGILHPGEAVTARLTAYDESHLRRLELVRVLREVGQLSVSRLKDLVDAAESTAPVHDMFAAAVRALAPTPPPPGPAHDEARRRAEEMVAEAGWTSVRPSSVDLDNLTGAFETSLSLVGRMPSARTLAPYVEAVDRLARTELERLDPEQDRAQLLEQMVIGQVLLGHLLTILRRLAEEHYSAQRFGRPDS
jgi:DNA-binding transcriptional MerR regulator